jgi:UDP-glucose 4-epimerase
VATDSHRNGRQAPAPRHAANERVLVLGGSGFIGSVASWALRDAGNDVRVLDVRGADRDGRDNAGIEHLVGAIEDRAVLEEALDGVTWVVHTVGCPPPVASTKPHDPTADGLAGIAVLLDALRERPGTVLTFLSSGGAVYGDVTARPVTEQHACRPISPYGISKLQAERAIVSATEHEGLRACILRVSNAYGARQNASDGQGVIAAFLDAARTGARVPIFGGGRAVRDFVHVDDVVRAMLALRPTRGGPRVVNVGAGVGHSVAAVREAVELVVGGRLNVEDLPWRSFDVQHIVLDVSLLHTLMSWEPRDLATGIAETWSELPGNDRDVRDQLLA